MISQDGIERNFLGIDLLKFFLKLRIVKIFDSMLDEIVPHHQDQITAQLIAGDCTFFGNIFLLDRTRTPVSKQQYPDLFGSW